MPKTATSGREVAGVQDRIAPGPEEIRRQLQIVLNSPVFHGSKRCQQFLEYVCEKSLSGESGALKERTIAIEVFGRQPQSDLGEDTIVRVGAREVRKRLAQFYVTPEGRASDIRIDLHPGAYAPEFQYANNPPEEVVAPSAPAAAPANPVVEVRRAPRRRRQVMVGVGLAVLAVGAVFAVVRVSGANPNADAFRRFWDPVLRDPEPMLLAVAHPIVYHPSWRAMKLSEANQPPRETQVQRAIQVPPRALDGSDLIPVFNQYVGFGDMVVANEVSTMLARKSKAVRLRLASSVVFEDLRKTQTLLIGAVTNKWTMELQQSWPFRFTWTPDMKTVISDTRNGRQWSIPAKEDGSAPEDYVVVCRIRNSFTGGTLMVAAGLKQFGTEAAGRLLADPEQLGVILRKLPAGWESRNLQLVLHARVIGNTPAQPEVVASSVW